MFVVKHRKIFYWISGILVILSFIFIFVFGLKPSIDFTGGSMIEIQYISEVPEQDSIEEVLINLGFNNAVVRKSGENGFFIKLSSIDDETKKALENKLTFDNYYSLEEKQFNTVGPTLGHELATKASIAVFLVMLAIIFYIAYVFRQVSKPVSSWKYGFVTIIALIHDIIITIGFFALAGKLIGIEIDTLFVTAILVILGYSVNDSIIILDRVRENLVDIPTKQRYKIFGEIVGKGLRETIMRSINTTFTTLLALIALFIFGGDVTKNFALALIVGIIAGAYSSIFLAAPMLVSFLGKKEFKESGE